MAYFYSDNGDRFTGIIDFNKIDATRKYLEHLGNIFHLEFIRDNTDSFIEKQQVEKELVIGKRKMNFWKRQPNFSIADASNGTNELKKMWRR